MRNAKYQQLFTIGVIHDYYIKLFCSDLSFVPTSKTQHIFKQYGMLIRPLQNGFTVLFNTNNNTPLHKISEDSEDNILTFIIKSNNPHFHHISDLTFDYKEKYTFNNQTSNINDKGHKLLHLSEHVGESEQIKDNSKPVRERDFGILEISLKSVEDDSYGIVVGENINHQIYTVHFDCRKTLWRYYLIPRNGKEYTSFQILSKNERKFTEPTPTRLLSGQEVTAMISTEVLDLKERSNEKFRLQFSEKDEEEISTRVKKITIQLPSPEARNVKPSDQESITYSDIYVYI